MSQGQPSKPLTPIVIVLIGMALLALIMLWMRRAPGTATPVSSNAAWTKTLPVPAGTSLRHGQKQDIWMQTVQEFRPSNPLWIAGKGSAIVDGKSGYYFWNSTTPPQVEVTVDTLDGTALQACAQAAEAVHAQPSLVLHLVGIGFFDPQQRGTQYLGVFRLNRIDSCAPQPLNDMQTYVG